MTDTGNMKRDDFVRLAERRTKLAIYAIRRLAKLGNRASYDYTPDHVEQITTTLERELDMVKLAMTPKIKNGKAEIEFRLTV